MYICDVFWVFHESGKKSTNIHEKRLLQSSDTESDIRDSEKKEKVSLDTSSLIDKKIMNLNGDELMMV